MNPAYYDDDGVAIFTKAQVDMYGFPEENNFNDFYWVVDNDQDYQFSYEQLLSASNNDREIHRYDREERFRLCLLQLTGRIGLIGKSRIMIEDLLWDDVSNFEREYLPECLVWEYFRKLLKKYKLNAFYNRIPAVARLFKIKLALPRLSSTMIKAILSDFNTMHTIFPSIKKNINRAYFPSLRAVCLLLMARYDIPNVMNIPIARTLSKQVQLKKCFDDIWDAIAEQLENDIFN
jgi:hypothetical protein